MNKKRLNFPEVLQGSKSTGCVCSAPTLQKVIEFPACCWPSVKSLSRARAYNYSLAVRVIARKRSLYTASVAMWHFRHSGLYLYLSLLYSYIRGTARPALYERGVRLLYVFYLENERKNIYPIYLLIHVLSTVTDSIYVHIDR